MKHGKIYISFLIIFFISYLGEAQTFNIDTTGTYNDPVYLIPNYLGGNGVTISNETWYGSPCQFGKFTNGLNYMGIDSGIIMTTGRVSQVLSSWYFTTPWWGQVSTPPSWMTSGANGYYFVPPSVIANGTNDFVRSANYSYSTLSTSYNPYNQYFSPIDTTYHSVAIMEFDIVPQADTLLLEYSYVSNCWGGWYFGPSNSGPVFPDNHDPLIVLASGPGISGPFSSAPGFPNGSNNFAWVPNRIPHLPITNCTLHGATFTPNTGYATNSHNTNPPGLGPPWYFPSSTFNFAGYSDIIKSKIPTIPCETYHIKIMVAKNYNSTTNDFVDSGVMLKAKSLSSQPKLTLVPESDFTLGFDTALVEGCGQTTIHFIRNTNISQSDTIHFNILGSATNGMDFSFLPDSVIFPIGADSVALSFTIPNDALVEGLETLVIDVVDSTYFLPCGNLLSTLLQLTISDQPPFVSITHGDTVSCIDSVAVVSVDIPSGMAPFQILWSNGDTNLFDTLLPAPLNDSMLFVTITDGCGNQIVDSAFIDVQNIPFSVNAISGQVSCANDSTSIGINVNSGYPPYSYSWFNGSSTNSTNVWVPYDTSYTVTITDVCNRDTLVSVPVSVFPYAPLSVSNIAADSFWCAPYVVLISSPNVNGGSGNYIMSFTQWADSSTIFSTQISNDTSIVLQVVDLCMQDTLTVQYDYDFLQDSPFTVQLPFDSTICHGDSVKFEARTSGGYPPYTYLWNTGNTTPFKWVNIAGTQNYSVTVTDGCGIEIVKSLTVRPKYITADFTFTTPEPLIVQLENQSTGADYYVWNFGDGNSSTLENPIHEYQIWNDYTISLLVKDSLGCVDSTLAFVRLPLEIYIPNAFTPNGDVHNNTFRIYGVWNDQLLEDFSVSIFDRWGQEVYSSSDIHFQWDGTSNGKPANSGVYSYLISVKFSHHDTQTRSGSVTVVR